MELVWAYGVCVYCGASVGMWSVELAVVTSVWAHGNAVSSL